MKFTLNKFQLVCSAGTDLMVGPSGVYSTDGHAFYLITPGGHGAGDLWLRIPAGQAKDLAKAINAPLTTVKKKPKLWEIECEWAGDKLTVRGLDKNHSQITMEWECLAGPAPKQVTGGFVEAQLSLGLPMLEALVKAAKAAKNVEAIRFTMSREGEQNEAFPFEFINREGTIAEGLAAPMINT